MPTPSRAGAGPCRQRLRSADKRHRPPIHYDFKLADGEYDLEIYFVDQWNGSRNPSVRANGVTYLKPRNNAARAQIASIIMRYPEG